MPKHQVAAAPRNTIAFAMSIVAGGLLVTYIALMISTIMFAAMQTQLSKSIRQVQEDLARLETGYYDAVVRMDGADPYALGYVTPERVQYVAARTGTGLTFAE